MAHYTTKLSDGRTVQFDHPNPSLSQTEVQGIIDQQMGGQKTDYKQVIGDSIKNMFQKPAAFAKDLGTNPQTMANAMPTALGTLGGISPFPGGATAGTLVGQGLRAGADKMMGSPVPGLLQHGAELGGAALGDVAAIPYVKNKIFGGQIGKLETAAGVPKKIRSLPMAVGQKSTGDFINDAMDSVEASQGRGTATYWKQIKDQIDRIYELGKDQGLTALDRTNLRGLNQDVQAGLNAAVKGREVPAQALAKSQTIPNFIGNTMREIPSKYKIAGIGGGAIGGALGIAEIVKKLLGG